MAFRDVYKLRLYMYRTNCHDLPELSRVPKIAQGKNALVVIIWPTKSELYEIWQAKGKQFNFDEFLHLTPGNSDFSVFSYFCFFNNFLLKSHN